MTVRDIITQWLKSHGCEGLRGTFQLEAAICIIDTPLFVVLSACDGGHRHVGGMASLV